MAGKGVVAGATLSSRPCPGLRAGVGPVLDVFSPPDELRVQILVAAFVGDVQRVFVLINHHRLVFGGGDVLAPGLGVGEGGDGFATGLVRCFRHAACVLWVSAVGQAAAKPLGVAAVVENRIDQDFVSFDLVVHRIGKAL